MLIGQGVPRLKGVKQGRCGVNKLYFRAKCVNLGNGRRYVQGRGIQSYYSPHRQYGHYSYRQTQTDRL